MADMLERRFNFAAQTELNLYYCGKRERALGHGYGPTVRNHFLLAFIEEGSARLFVRGNTLQLSGGELLVMFPGEKVAYEALPDAPWTVVWLGVFGALVPEYFQVLGVSCERPTYLLPRPAATFEALRAIVDLSASEKWADKLEVIARLHHVFALLAEGVEARRTHGDYVAAALSFIHFHYDQGIEANDVAKYMNLSPGYLSRLFRQEVGIAPGEWILRERTERACALLRESALSVGEIARAVGVEDPLYFSRLFRRRTGLSPSAYRAGAGDAAPSESSGGPNARKQGEV